MTTVAERQTQLRAEIAQHRLLLADNQTTIEKCAKLAEKHALEIAVAEAELRGIEFRESAECLQEIKSSDEINGKRRRRDIRALVLQKIQEQPGLSTVAIATQVGNVRGDRIENALAYLEAQGEIRSWSGSWYVLDETRGEPQHQNQPPRPHPRNERRQLASGEVE